MTLGNTAWLEGVVNATTTWLTLPWMVIGPVTTTLRCVWQKVLSKLRIKLLMKDVRLIIFNCSKTSRMMKTILEKKT